MKNNKTALITGANGFTGAHLSYALINKGIRVIGIQKSKKKPFNRSVYAPGMYVPIIEDVRNKAAMQRIFSRFQPDYCIHLAAKSTVEEGIADPSDTYDVNFNGTLTLLESSRLHPVEKLIIPSTVHVYGNNPNLPFREEYFPRSSRPYETSKICVDLIALSYARTFHLPVTIPRFVNLYGPGDTNVTRIIPTLMKQIILDGSINIWCGDTIRDYLYIDDAIAAYLRLLETKNSDSAAVVNFGSDSIISIRRLVRKMIPISGKKVSVSIMKKIGRPHEVKKQYVSTDKARNYYHWEPRVSLEEGLRQTFAWYTRYFTEKA